MNDENFQRLRRDLIQLEAVKKALKPGDCIVINGEPLSETQLNDLIEALKDDDESAAT